MMYFLKYKLRIRIKYKFVIFLLYPWYFLIFCSDPKKLSNDTCVMCHIRNSHTKAVRIYIFTLSAKKLRIIKDTRTHLLIKYFLRVFFFLVCNTDIF